MSTTGAIADLEDRGFVKVDCASCGRDDVWLRCNNCEKSDHFVVDADGAHCACGADYDHASCLCGETVPKERLRFTPFAQGPMNLADLEWDPVRLGVAAVLLLALVGGGLFWALG
ncbi:MAG: hypothetical protein H6741_23890 [Alphaproteobacteria bacterium]|nr:hypothetical protein [Alphaproteobacteria bacterium]